MHIEWMLDESYEALGGLEVVERMVKTAVSHIPLDHQRHLSRIVLLDYDPRGRNLGVYQRDHTGNRVELYLMSHVRDSQLAHPEIQHWVFLLHIAHTLFHEVGHHVTLTINKRMAPSKGRAGVTDAKEKWAEQYVAKRMTSFIKLLIAPGGVAHSDILRLESARRCLLPVAGITEPIPISIPVYPATDD
jgi:predicted Zn-dependent protease with MMP-like domain